MDTSAIIMLGGYSELALDGGDGIGGPGGGSGFTVPVMASLGQAYGVDDDEEDNDEGGGASGGLSADQIIALIGTIGGVITPVITGLIGAATAADGNVDMQALISGLQDEQAAAAQTGTGAGGLTMQELMAIVTLLQNNSTPEPEPEPEGLHPAIWATIAIGGVSVVMLIAALLMGRGGRNTRIKALTSLRNLRKPKQRRLASPW